MAGSWAHYSLQIRTALAGTPGGLGMDDLSGLPGRLLWPAYLSGRSGGASVVRSIWETLDGAGESSDLWAATDEVLRGSGSSLDEAFADYSLWLQLRRTAQEGNTEPVPYAGEYAAFPAAEIQTATPLAPFGATYLRFASDGLEGGLRLSLEGDAPGRFQAQLLLTPRKPGAPLVHAVVSLDTRGHGSIGIPWATYGEVVLIVGNVMRGGAPATYSFVARPDPTFPFELTSLAADAEETDVRLTWETRSESGLFGWIVYRSEQSNGPPHRVNDLIVPAIGDGDGPVAYQYLDDGVARGRTYFYRLVGITHDGLVRELPETRVDFPK